MKGSRRPIGFQAHELGHSDRGPIEISISGGEENPHGLQADPVLFQAPDLFAETPSTGQPVGPANNGLPRKRRRIVSPSQGVEQGEPHDRSQLLDIGAGCRLRGNKGRCMGRCVCTPFFQPTCKLRLTGGTIKKAKQHED